MNIVYGIFVYIVWFLATYYIVVFSLILFMGKDKLHEKKEMPQGKNPFVSVVVPAFNEEGYVASVLVRLSR